MSSHFSSNTRRRNSPSWCKPGMFPKIPAYVDDRPAAMNAFARWYDPLGTDQLDLTEVIRLTRSTTFNGWTGVSAETGYNLKIEIREYPNRTTYDLNLYARLGQIHVDDMTWIHEQPLQEPRFDTRLRIKTWTPNLHYAQLRVLG